VAHIQLISKRLLTILHSLGLMKERERICIIPDVEERKLMKNMLLNRGTCYSLSWWIFRNPCIAWTQNYLTYHSVQENHNDAAYDCGTTMRPKRSCLHRLRIVLVVLVVAELLMNMTTADDRETIVCWSLRIVSCINVHEEYYLNQLFKAWVLYYTIIWCYFAYGISNNGNKSK
jgi:hypothetical protein